MIYREAANAGITSLLLISSSLCKTELRVMFSSVSGNSSWRMNINPSRLSTVFFSWIEALKFLPCREVIRVLHSLVTLYVFETWSMTFAMFALTFLKALRLALKDETLRKHFGSTEMFNKNFSIFYFSFTDKEA